MGHAAPDSTLTNDIVERARDVATLNRALFNQTCPVYERINHALASFTEGTTVANRIKLPPLKETLICDKPGMAFLASLPEKQDPCLGRVFKNQYIESYELINDQGVCHNTRFDKRTSGPKTFHIADYGYSVPYDKTKVSKEIAAKLLLAALNPPKEDKVLPFTRDWGSSRAEAFASLLVNPVVVPGVEGFTQEQSMETLVLAPGSLIANLDFIERIFGNAGNQFRAEDNLALNPEHWTGDTGVIIFAPHITQITLEEMGIDPASLNSSNKDIKLYNDGDSFLLKIRDSSGVVITIVGDNYFGLGKKTIMTDASFSADRRGNTIQEHAGGNIVFAESDSGGKFSYKNDAPKIEGATESYHEALALSCGELVAQDEGYAIDSLEPDNILLNETAEFTLNDHQQIVTWHHEGQSYYTNLDPDKNYFLPNGMSVRMQCDDILEKGASIIAWKLIGRSAKGTFNHKSDTVSGGGKSELSKPVDDILRAKQLSVSNLHDALDGVDQLINLHENHFEIFKNRFKYGSNGRGRGALDDSRSLSSLVKLMTASPQYTDQYNELISKIPDESKLMLAHLHMIKSSGDNISSWRKRFVVDKINRRDGKHLYFDNKPVPVCYMRLGCDASGEENLLMLRPDYWRSFFLKQEDDLTVSVLVPTPKEMPHRIIKGLQRAYGYCARVIKNMERRYFNRTDEAKIRGAEGKAERDIAATGNFFTNFEPCPLSEAEKIVSNRVAFDKYTAEQKRNILNALAQHQRGEKGYFVVSDRARVLQDGSRSTNPRYLEDDDSLNNPKPYREAEIANHLCRNVPFDQQIYNVVDFITPARRLNTTDYTSSGAIVPHIAIYPPLMIQDTPELLEDLICSVTGKSPSTTGGLGSESAGTKGPFNCMPHVHYLNNQIRALCLSNEPVITTAAERIGPNYYIGHDLSIAAKEVFARVQRDELQKQRLLDLGYIDLEPDVEHNGEISKGGSYYYFTKLGMLEFFGRVFLTSDSTWSNDQIKPWEQNSELYVEGKKTLNRFKKEIALKYFNDGSIELASQPLKAILHMMAFDKYEFTPPPANDDDTSRIVEKVVWTRESPEYRALFTSEAIFNSAEYLNAIKEARRRDVELYTQQVTTLESFINGNQNNLTHSDLNEYTTRLGRLKQKKEWAESNQHIDYIMGSIGADNLQRV